MEEGDSVAEEKQEEEEDPSVQEVVTAAADNKKINKEAEAEAEEVSIMDAIQQLEDAVLLEATSAKRFFEESMTKIKTKIPSIHHQSNEVEEEPINAVYSNTTTTTEDDIPDPSTEEKKKTKDDDVQDKESKERNMKDDTMQEQEDQLSSSANDDDNDNNKNETKLIKKKTKIKERRRKLVLLLENRSERMLSESNESLNECKLKKKALQEQKEEKRQLQHEHDDVNGNNSNNEIINVLDTQNNEDNSNVMNDGSDIEIESSAELRSANSLEKARKGKLKNHLINDGHDIDEHDIIINRRLNEQRIKSKYIVASPRSPSRDNNVKFFKFLEEETDGDLGEGGKEEEKKKEIAVEREQEQESETIKLIQNLEAKHWIEIVKDEDEIEQNHELHIAKSLKTQRVNGDSGTLQNGFYTSPRSSPRSPGRDHNIKFFDVESKEDDDDASEDFKKRHNIDDLVKLFEKYDLNNDNYLQINELRKSYDSINNIYAQLHQSDDKNNQFTSFNGMLNHFNLINDKTELSLMEFIQGMSQEVPQEVPQEKELKEKRDDEKLNDDTTTTSTSHLEIPQINCYSGSNQRSRKILTISTIDIPPQKLHVDDSVAGNLLDASNDSMLGNSNSWNGPGPDPRSPRAKPKIIKVQY